MPLTAGDVDSVAFGNAPVGRRGYAKQEVDSFLQRIARTLTGEDDLTAAEVHHVEFSRPHLGKRGYHERDVDAFLDQAEDELLRRSGHAGGYEVPHARTAGQAQPDLPGAVDANYHR